jgi:hypothetical protein
MGISTANKTEHIRPGFSSQKQTRQAPWTMRNQHATIVEFNKPNRPVDIHSLTVSYFLNGSNDHGCQTAK